MFCNGANIACHCVIIDVGRFLAVAANKEDAVVMATRMSVGDIGVRTLNAHRDIVRDEQVKDAIDAVWRNPLAPQFGDIVSNVIGGRRLFFSREGIEDGSAHWRPLLILSLQSVAGCVCQIRAGWFVMMMVFGHIC